MMKHRQANLPKTAPPWSRQPCACRGNFQPRTTIGSIVLLLILLGAFPNAYAAPNNSVRTLITDRRGSVWLGTANGVFYVPKRDTDPSHRLHLLPSQVVTAMLEDRDGSILVGTRNGLYRIQDGKALTIKGLPDPLILSLTLDSMGYVWAGTGAGGLAYINKESATPMPINSGLPLLSVQKAVEDSTGNLWLHTSRGVLRVSLQDLHDIMDGRKDQLTSVLLEKADSTPWLLSRDGATQAHGATEKLDLSPPTATITGWSLSNEDKPSAGGAHVELTAGQPQTTFFFNAGPSHSSAQVEYRYRLTNYDTDWNVTRTGEARYHRLDFGKYNFEVQARNIGEPWKTPVASLPVYQRPHLYQTWYTYLVLLLLGALLAAHLVRRRVQMMKGRIGIVFEERSRIAAECHDTLMAGFAAISWQLEATAKLFHESGAANTPAAQSFELARSMVSHCQAEARRIIWDLRGTNEVTNLLSQALSSTLAENYIRERVQTKLDVEGTEVPLAPGCVHHLLCIGQEAVSNAMRHGEPTQVSVRLKYETDSLSLTIRDDGRGFHPSEVATSRRGHFGIPVMEERARKLRHLQPSDRPRYRHGSHREGILQRHAAAPGRAPGHRLDRNMKQIRVLLIEDHFLARMALHSVLSGHSQISIVGEAADGEMGLTMFRALRPDVVVLICASPASADSKSSSSSAKNSPTPASSSSPTTRAAKTSTAPFAAEPWPISPRTPAAKNSSAPSRTFIAACAISPVSPSTSSPNACPPSTSPPVRPRCSPASPRAVRTARSPKSSTSPKRRSASMSAPCWTKWAPATAPRPPSTPCSAG